MLALANGFIAALPRTGSADNVLLMRRGADSEMSSGIARDVIGILSSFPHVATGADGHPMVSPETYLIINIPRAGADSIGCVGDTCQASVANVVVRGVSERS